MMTQEQVASLLELEQYIAIQASAIALDEVSNLTQAKIDNFLSSGSESAPVLNQPAENSPSKEPLKHLLIGSPKAVTHTIYYFQGMSYAQVGDWSRLLPIPNSDEVMSILKRSIMVQ